MTHLSPQEFVDAAEGGLDGRRLAHLDGCEACRRELDAMRAMLDDAAHASPVPDPSPLFWEHFPRRVHEAVAAEATRPRANGWATGWRGLVLVGSVAAVVALAVLLRTPAAPPLVDPIDRAAGDVTAPAAGTDGTDMSAEQLAAEQADAMALIAGLASGLPSEEVRAVARPSAHAASAAIEQLTPEQQAELVRLIQAEIDGG